MHNHNAASNKPNGSSLPPFRGWGRGRGHNSLSIHIPTPCHENWDAMTPVQEGRFCQSCAKQVVDFSLMTDNEVLKYFANATGNTCGRFATSQLQRSLQPAKQGKKKLWWVAAMMPLLVLAKKSYAQGMVASLNIKPVKEKIMLSQFNTVEHVGRNIFGTITNLHGEPVPFASIMVNGRSAGVNADSAGNFSITVPAKLYSTQLLVNAVGYRTNYFFVHDNTSSYNIQLQPDEFSLPPVIVESKETSRVVEVMAGGVWATRCVRKIPLADTVRKIFLGPAFTVFPNPAPRGSSVNIDVKKEGNYTIQLFDNSGKLVLVNTFNGAKGATQTQITVPSSAPAGMYYIRLIEERKKKQYTDKIVVM